MNKRSRDSDENPLNHLADELSSGLQGKPIELTETNSDRVEGGQVWMKQSAARTVQASAVHLENSAAGLVRTGSLDAVDSMVGPVMTHEARLQDVATPLLVGRNITAKEVRAVGIFAGNIQGDVKTIFTPVTALLAGAGFALTFFGLLQLASQKRKKRTAE
jgi:hypothetical protein